MKKAIFIFFIFLLNLTSIEAESTISTNTTTGTASESKACTTDICCSSIGIDFEGEPTDGINAILYDSNNKKIASKKLWFTEAKAKVVGANSSDNIETIYNKHNEINYLEGVYNFAELLVNADYEDVEIILKKINSSYTIENKKDYYLVIEPIFKLKYKYYSYEIFSTGTLPEIWNQMYNNPSGCKKNRDCYKFAKYFLYKDYPDCQNKSGLTKRDGSCGNWNVIKNYLTYFQLSKKQGKFNDMRNLTYVKEMIDTYDTNKYGKGIINISEVVKNECEYKLQNGSKTSENLINLWKQFPENTNLLNFSNPSCTPANCSVSDSVSCLSGNLNVSFSSNNVSCYMKKLADSNNNPVFCAYSSNFINQLGKTNFSGLSGQLYMKSEDGIATKNNFNMTCYSYGNNSSLVNYPKYSDYIKSVKLGGKELQKAMNSDLIPLEYKRLDGYNVYYLGNWNELTKSGDGIEVDYRLPAVYVENISGKKRDTNCNNCTFLGYGKYSKMTSENISGQLIFSYEYVKPNSSQIQEKQGFCKYYLYEGLVKNNKPMIEYRSVETNDSFLGISGKGRKTGRNWCDYLDCSSNNDLVKKVMSKNDSANKLKQDPIYNIKLTVDDIKKIREYNKETTYDDYNFTCDNGICYSEFLIGLKEGVIKTIKTKESLIMSNKLVVN